MEISTQVNVRSRLPERIKGVEAFDDFTHRTVTVDVVGFDMTIGTDRIAYVNPVVCRQTKAGRDAHAPRIQRTFQYSGDEVLFAYNEFMEKVCRDRMVGNAWDEARVTWRRRANQELAS